MHQETREEEGVLVVLNTGIATHQGNNHLKAGIPAIDLMMWYFNVEIKKMVLSQNIIRGQIYLVIIKTS